MNYAEAAFAGPDITGRTYVANHCQHVAAYEDAKRLERIKRTNAALVRGRSQRRGV